MRWGGPPPDHGRPRILSLDFFILNKNRADVHSVKNVKAWKSGSQPELGICERRDAFDSTPVRTDQAKDRMIVPKECRARKFPEVFLPPLKPMPFEFISIHRTLLS